MINIIPCYIGQVDILTEIAVKTYKQTYAYLWLDDGEYYLNRFYEKETIEAELSKPGTHFFLVYNGDEITGYFKLKETAYATYPEQNSIEIDKLYLLKETTGKGVGKKVMNYIFEWAKSQRRVIVWLMVMESSPAKTFYESFGFKQTGRSQLDYPNMIDKYRWILTMVAGDGE